MKIQKGVHMRTQIESIVGILGIMALLVLVGILVTVWKHIFGKGDRQAMAIALEKAGVSKDNAQFIIEHDEGPDVLEALSDIPKEQLRTIIAGLSNKAAGIVSQIKR
jgi:cbb3-type cytochrome oxidase subunit 3